MMRAALVLLCLVVFGSIKAQNLVPNGSFEEYTECPSYFGLATFCTGWQNLYTQSADYFHACHTSGVVGVPLNQFGYQYPAQGDAYMGIATYQFNQQEYREMVGIQLAEPLQVGVPVCLSFKMAVGGFGTSAGNSAGYTCKGLGLRFFNGAPIGTYIYDYPNSAALYMDAVPTDTAIWYVVEGTYVPDSAYDFVVTGNFFDEFHSTPVIQDSIGGGASDFAYAFIDDVRVSFNLDYCSQNTALSTLVHPTPLAYLEPGTELLYVQLPERSIGALRYVLYDEVGQCVGRGWIPVGVTEFVTPLPALADGAYVMHVISTQEHYAPVRFVKVSP